MKKENFICPCCGLPNHLEFQNEEDYNRVREQEATGVVGNINTIFNKYLVGDEEGRNPSNEIKLELKARLEKIQQISNRFNEQSFQDWFDKNVVCFINEQEIIEDYIRYMLLTYNIEQYGQVINQNIIEEYMKVLLDNYKIDQHTYIPIDPVNIEEHTQYDLSLQDLGTLNEHTYVYNAVTYHYYGKDGSNASIIRGDN